MRIAIWIAIGWFGVTLDTALALRLGPAYIFPDAAVVVLVFLSLHRQPIPMAIAAAAFGYLVGRQAGAPVGLHESAMVITAIGVYVVAGHLAGSGALFFGMITAAATVGYHAALFVLLYVFRGEVGFSSWATTILLLNGLATGTMALIFHRPMQWIERKMAVETYEGLQWR